MRDALLIVGFIGLAGALLTGVLGFLGYPAKARGKKKHKPSPQQGFARAMFVIFAAAAFVAFFFGIQMPD